MRGPKKSQKAEKQNTTADKPFHNVTTNDPLSHHSNDTMHQSTKSKPLSRRLSLVRILSHAAVHAKKETSWGALTFQMSFQGKTTEEEPCNLW